MPFFKYLAKNEHGETIKGKVEARGIDLAASILNNRGLLVIKVTPLNESSFSAISSKFMGVKQDDIVNMTRQLSTMITAGLSLSGALSILAEQGRPAMSVLMNDLLREIEGGSTFAAALEKKSDVFSRVYIQLVRAGEAGGVLDEVLGRLADTLEKDKEFRGKIKGAMIYPIIVVVALIVVTFVMMIFVIPQLTEMYKDFGAELPFLTQLVMDISTFFINFWWMMIGGMAAGLFALKKWISTEGGARRFDEFLLKLPVFGELRKKIVITELARTLSLLLSAGVSLIEGLEIVAEAIESVNFRDALQSSIKQVEKGIPLSTALSGYKFFPPILFQMTAVGEETGKLDDVLQKLSVYFESESDQQVKNLTTALEPMIMIILGLGVGVMVVAIIMPIYSLTSQF